MNGAELLWRAIALWVLEPEDVIGPPDAESWTRVRPEALPPAEVRAALAQLCELQPRPPGAPPVLARRGATLSPPPPGVTRHDPRASAGAEDEVERTHALDTSLPERAPGAEVWLGGPVAPAHAPRAQTLLPEEATPASGDISLRPVGGTVAEERGLGGLPGPAGGSGEVLLGARPGTLALARGEAPVPGEVSLQPTGGTLAVELGSGSPSPPAGGVFLGQAPGTLAPARELEEDSTDSPLPTPTAVERAGAFDPLPLLQLELLPAGERRAIEQAAFARQAQARELATPTALRQAREHETLSLEEALVEQGGVEFSRAFDLRSRISEPRSTCERCLAVREGGRCVRCPEEEKGWAAPQPGQTLVGSSRAERVTLTEGQRLGDYELLERVAEGGMGVVFRARQLRLNRVVALKVMRGGSGASPRRRRRFLREAEAAAALSHPAIVPVHETGEADGHAYYTMDLVDGLPLNVHAARQGLTPREVCRLMRALAEGVQHFHMCGIIHRDLKPDNVLVGAKGPRIIDFGIAKKVGANERQTLEGDLMGTIEYMAPEQAAGRIREIDARTDVYALGVMLYELLCGTTPWRGLSEAQLLLKVREGEVPPLRKRNPAIEVDLALIVEKALAPERERRYQSAHELAEDLRCFEDDLPVRARPATWSYRLRKAIRRRFPAVVATSIALLGVALGGGWVLSERWAHRARLGGLLAQAEDATLSDFEREQLLGQVLGLQPDHPLATSRLELLRQRRHTEEELERERVRRAMERAEAKAAREKAERLRAEAEQEAQAAAAAEEAREEARRQADVAAVARARRRFAEAEASSDPFTRIALLHEALNALDRRDPALREELETATLDLALTLARAALDDAELGLARYWLRIAGGLAAEAPEVVALRDALTRLASGQRDLEEARAFIQAGDWLAARSKLARARVQGLPAERCAADAELVTQRCRQRAAGLLGEARQLLGTGEALAALGPIHQALDYDAAASGATELLAAAERRACAEGLRQAALRFRAPATRHEAPAGLAQALALVQAPELRARLETAQRALEELLGPLAGSDLVFVPGEASGSLRSFIIQRTELTWAAYADFVEAEGYAQPAWWDPEARALLGELSPPPAPQDAGRRPVRGLSYWEARAYARWYSEQTGARWRLPAAAEWERAAGWDPASARQQTYPWGEDFAGRLLLGAAIPSAVGAASGDRSPLGLVDCAGNVLEWVTRAEGPATKGAAFSASAAAARHYARVTTTGTPAARPPAALRARIGLRLVRELTR